MHWSAQYVGTPYVKAGRAAGALDCWGLVWAVYLDQLCIEIPSYSDVDALNLIAVARAVRGGEASSIWRGVDSPQEFDVVVMRGLIRDDGRLRTMHFHVGVMVDHRRVLHTEEATSAVIVPVNRGDMIGRIKGYYRHASL